MSSISFPSYHRQSKFAARTKGFGMIELMVTISIMLVISSLILVKQTSFNGATLLRSQVYDVALALRELQLSVVSAESDGSGTFRSVQGAYFNTANNSTYRIFKDADGDYSYDTSEEYGKQGFLDGRFEVRAIRAIGASITGTGLSVIFIRPNYDAKFYDSNGQVAASSVEIDIARKGVVGSAPDVVRTLEVTATGQITVK